MGAVTTRIGLGATLSISHQHPFYAARLWATLDHLTRGRAAWNVVTSLNQNQAANHGEERRPTDERYDRAHEFMEVCRKLWDSWEPDAVVMDREAGVFADPAKVHRIEHVGGSSGRAVRSTSSAHRRTGRRSSRRGRRPRAAQRHGQSVGLLQMAGTPAEVADQMEDYVDQVGGDGFMLSPIYTPGAIEEFVDLVVPELQRRGRDRLDYAGTTQRDHLMQEV